MRFTGTLMLVFASMLLGACAASSSDVNPIDPPSFDGLLLVPRTVIDRVWIRPGYTLSDYRKVILESARIQYRPKTRAAANGLVSPVTAFPLNAAQKQEIGILVTDAFARSLERLTLTRVTEPGPDVLRVRSTLLDLDVQLTGDRETPYRVDSIGQLTFAVELIDSQTDAVLLRAVDTRAARVPGQPYPSKTASERLPLRRVIERWADLLVDTLNDLTNLDQLQGT